MKLSIFLFAFVFSSQGFAAEYLVKYNNSQAVSLIQNLTSQKSLSLQIHDQNLAASLLLVDIGPRVEGETLANLLSQPGVEYVVPNSKVFAFTAPLDAAALKTQWANSKVQIEKAWTLAGNRGNKNVIVAVLDTGVDYNHESLSPNMIAGYDFKDNDSDPMDVKGFANPGHGTHCSGSIGATGLIDGGIVGVSPEVSIMPLRFLGPDGSGDLNSAIKAIDYAIEKGAQIISASWGAALSKTNAAPLLEAVKRADDKGIVFVSAASNDGKNNDEVDMYPANNGFPNSITVAASNSYDAKPTWSNFGTERVHLAAPGESIASTLPGNSYGSLSGTSMATPLVAGLVAFLKAQDPALTGAQIRAVLQSTGINVNIQTACNCRVDALQAVTLVLSKRAVVVPAAATLAKNTTSSFSVLNGRPPFIFSSNNPAVLSIDPQTGEANAMKPGIGIITATDADGRIATSLSIHVKAVKSGDERERKACPFGNEKLCGVVCKVLPFLSYCKK